MKIAIAQNNYSAGDIEENKKRIEQSIGTAKIAGAKVLVLARNPLAGTPLYSLKPCGEMPDSRDVRVVAESEEGETIIVSAADRFEHGGVDKRIKYYAETAKKAGKPLIYVNQLGGQGDIVFEGASFVLDEKGRLVKLLKSFEEDFVVIDTSEMLPQAWITRDKTAEMHDAIVFGLKEYFSKNSFTKACLGMSGGIDSAVVLALIAQVLPPENIEAVMMPSQFSSSHSITDSQEMIARLGVRSELIPIAPAFECVAGCLEPIFAGTPFGTAEENLQSRLRGIMLMALSNKHGHILLNTSNKSEAAVGYGTLYGDMAGSLAPIADLYKTEIYDLARYINREREIIPVNIIDKAPSAELRPEQKDLDSLPPYDILDAILRQLVEGGLVPKEIEGFDVATVRRVWKLLSRAEFKRRQSAPAIKLSTRPFGEEGFRLPLI